MTNEFVVIFVLLLILLSLFLFLPIMLLVKMSALRRDIRDLRNEIASGKSSRSSEIWEKEETPPSPNAMPAAGNPRG